MALKHFDCNSENPCDVVRIDAASEHTHAEGVSESVRMCVDYSRPEFPTFPPTPGGKVYHHLTAQNVVDAGARAPPASRKVSDGKR